jgi:hypothetical protein
MRRFSRFLLLALVAVRADVEAVLGVPAGNYDWAEEYTGIGRSIYFGDVLTIAPPASVTVGTWVSQHGSVSVAFDNQQRMCWKSETRSRIVPPWQRWWQGIWER